MRHSATLLGILALVSGAWAQTAPLPAETVPASASEIPATPAPSASPAEDEARPWPAPSPAPPVDPEKAAEQARISAVNELFAAVFHGDAARVRELIASGTNANHAMPVPVDPATAELFRPTVLDYFLSGERGLTPLMVAATLGHREVAEILLQSGANPDAQTKRHGTNALWLAGYTGKTDVTKLLLGVQPGSEADRMRIEIDLDGQTAQLFVDNVGEKAVPISSGRKSHPTPKGEFVVTNKHRHWRSTIYGASMPFYLRLSGRAFGLHAGQLPGYPASHGCIRLNKKDAQDFFEHVPLGTIVVIK